LAQKLQWDQPYQIVKHHRKVHVSRETNEKQTQCNTMQMLQ